MRGASIIFIQVIGVIHWILTFVVWTVTVWVIFSWILFFASQTSFRWRYRSAFNILMQLNDIFTRMTYPLLRPFRRLLRRVDTAGIDWSPLLLLIAIWLLRALLDGVVAAILTP
jgi:uncharacterized protein YggT (Ycf19 family)